MYHFKHEFREFHKEDYMAYPGAQNNLNGDKPVICDVYNDDTEVSIIISGDSENNHTRISLITEDAEYQIRTEGYNMRHIAIADSIVDYLVQDIDNLKEAVNGAVVDYAMQTIILL